MLTKELAIFDFDGLRIVPDRLVRKRHARYLEYAAGMCDAYRTGIGRTRRELHLAVHRIFDAEADCPPARIDAFCKLLDEERVARYQTDRAGKAAALRQKVCRLAAPCHPLVDERTVLFEHAEKETKEEIARQLGRASWEEVERELFADVFEFNRLLSFEGYDSPEALLARYNVAQVQAALFNATRLTVHAGTDFRRIVTHAKLARLLHTITLAQRGGRRNVYTIVLDGPASVLRETRRYGASMAKFLPALVSCTDWRMRAELMIGRIRRPFFLEISSADGLHSPMPPQEEFDTSVEEHFARKWGGRRRKGWLMRREGGILEHGQTVMVPDFVFHHKDGRMAWLEIVGFWTPEYLQAKVEKLKLFNEEPIIVAVAEGVARGFHYASDNVMFYKKALRLDAVQDALERVARKSVAGHATDV